MEILILGKTVFILRRVPGVFPGSLCPACDSTGRHTLVINDKELLPIQSVTGDDVTVGPLECEEAGEYIDL